MRKSFHFLLIATHSYLFILFNQAISRKRSLSKFFVFVSKGVEPVAGTTWNEDASEKFQAMVVDQTFQVEIISSDVRNLDHSRPIQVVLHGSINGKRSSVADQLVQLGFAKPVMV